MHRQKTKLSKRVNRVVSSVERRGIVATYEVHDRLLGNRDARRRFVSDEAQLDETQRGLLEALDRDGYVTLPFTDLHSQETWERLAAQGAAFVEETERTIAAGGQGKVRAGKEFVVRAWSFEGATLGGDDAWFSASTSRRILDVANAYLRLWAKLSYVDLWYTAQQPASDERVASQNWHVDFDDKHLLKAFVYLTDVDADHGPFEYVPGSQAGGRRIVREWVPMGYGRVSDDELAEKVPDAEIASFTGPKGTLILCNTSGLHRGGFATAGPRVLATATYCSPASLKALSNRNYASDARDDRPGRSLRRRLTVAPGGTEERLVDALGRPLEQRSDDAPQLPREEPLRRPALAPGPWTWNERIAGWLTCGCSFGAASEKSPASTLMKSLVEEVAGEPTPVAT